MVLALLMCVLPACGDDDDAAASGGQGSSQTGSQNGSNIKLKKNEERCPTCKGTGECLACMGDGRCHYCDGSGKRECYSCWGTDYCFICGGDGQDDEGRRCGPCSGKGTCTNKYCDQGKEECATCDGYKGCTFCNNAKECPTCGGEGKFDTTKVGYLTYYKKAEHNCFYGSIVCERCTDGTCIDCGGTGKEDCFTCQTTGKCIICDGEKVTWSGAKCGTCDGTGNCHRCIDGTGQKDCGMCEGTTYCYKCRGQYERKCPYCVNGYVFDEYGYNYSSGGNGSGSAENGSGSGSGYDPWPDPFADECDYCYGERKLPCTCSRGQCVHCGGDAIIPYYGGYGKTKYKDCSYCFGGACSRCGGTNYEDCPYC